MATQAIQLELGDKTYTLTFTNATIKRMDAMGITVGKLHGDVSYTLIEGIIKGAFLAKHGEELNSRQIDEIVAEIDDTEGLFEELVELYTTVFSRLVHSKEKGKKASWKVVK